MPDSIYCYLTVNVYLKIWRYIFQNKKNVIKHLLTLISMFQGMRFIKYYLLLICIEDIFWKMYKILKKNKSRCKKYTAFFGFGEVENMPEIFFSIWYPIIKNEGSTVLEKEKVCISISTSWQIYCAHNYFIGL